MMYRTILAVGFLLLCGAAFAFGFSGHPVAVRIWDGVVRGMMVLNYCLVEYPAQRLIAVVRWWRNRSAE